MQAADCKTCPDPHAGASISAVVSCFLSAAHVKAGKLTVASSEIDQLEAGEVVNLVPKKRGMLGTLLAAWLHAFWGTLTAPKAKRERTRKSKRAKAAKKKQEKLDDAVRAEIARTVREILEQERSSQDSAGPAEDEDFEVKREYYISLLEPRQERVLRLTCFEKVPQEAVAEELGVTVRRVQDIKAQAINELAEMYGLTAGRK